MTRYLALLGSINVGGNRLKMADLKTALEDSGFDNVTTVIASGNVLFEHNRAGDETLAKEIEAIVKDRFGIVSFATVRTRDDVEQAIAANPFARDGEEKFVHTVFLEEPVDGDAVDAFAKVFPGPERIAAGGRELFIDYSASVARSQIDPAMQKAKLIKGRATARNIRSLRRILDKMDA